MTGAPEQSAGIVIAPRVPLVDLPARLTNTAGPGAQDFKAWTEGHKIRAVSRRDQSELGFQTQKRSGRPRRHPKSVSKRNFKQSDGIPHCLNHSEVGAC